MGGGAVRGKPRSARARPSLGRASGSLGRVHECTRGERERRAAGGRSRMRARSRGPPSRRRCRPLSSPPPSLHRTHSHSSSILSSWATSSPGVSPQGSSWLGSTAAIAGGERRGPARVRACGVGARPRGCGARRDAGGGHREEKRRAGSELAAFPSCFTLSPALSPLSPQPERARRESSLTSPVCACPPATPPWAACCWPCSPRSPPPR